MRSDSGLKRHHNPGGFFVPLLRSRQFSAVCRFFRIFSGARAQIPTYWCVGKGQTGGTADRVRNLFAGSLRPRAFSGPACRGESTRDSRTSEIRRESDNRRFFCFFFRQLPFCLFIVLIHGVVVLVVVYVSVFDANGVIVITIFFLTLFFLYFFRIDIM